MNKIEKYIIAVITLIAVGAIGTAIYFGVNKTNDTNNSKENIVENNYVDNEELDSDNKLDEETNLVDNDNSINWVSCDSEKEIKTLSYENFNEIEEYNICTIYEIQDMGLQISVSSYYSGGPLYVFEKHINGKELEEKDDFRPTSIEVTKYNNYIVLTNNAVGDDVFNLHIYDKQGNLKYFIDSGDEKGCQHILTDNKKEIKFYKNYGMNQEDFASNTCEDKFIGGVEKNCKNGERLLDIYYTLEENNGKFELKQSGFECIK